MMDVESEVVELRLIIKDLEDENKRIMQEIYFLSESNERLKKYTIMLTNDYVKRKNMGMEELVGVVYG